MNNKMMILIIVAILFVGSITSGVIVNEVYKANAPRTCEDFISVGYVWLPEKISTIFLNDHLILHFFVSNGKNITIYGVVKDHGIFDLRCNTYQNPDAEVWMRDTMALELATSTTPITTFVNGWRTGKITLNTFNQETKNKLSNSDSLIQDDYEPVPIGIRAIFEKFISK